MKEEENILIISLIKEIEGCIQLEIPFKYVPEFVELMIDAYNCLKPINRIEILK